MILSQLQSSLQYHYDLAIPYSISQFVTHDATVANELVTESNSSTLATAQHQAVRHQATSNDSTMARPAIGDERVFIEQQDDTLSFTLYLDRELIAKIESSSLNTECDHSPANPESGDSRVTLDMRCTVVEGVSHAVCLLWHAHNDRQIRPVDLELQAEVDKYLLLSRHFTRASQHRHLIRCLFTNCTYSDTCDNALQERYRTANGLASRYCSWLSQRYTHRQSQTELSTELARFYRLSGRAKFEHIKSLH